jgi:hypothetical protein
LPPLETNPLENHFMKAACATPFGLRLLFMAVAAAIFGSGLALAEPSAPVSGTWTGSFDITHPDGRVENSSICLTLSQAGNLLTGGVGKDAQSLSPIESGVVAGSDIRFNLTAPGKMSLTFSLHRDAERLNGEADGDLRGEHVSALIVAGRNTGKEPVGAPVSQALFDDIEHMDEILFTAFNQRDLATLSTLFAPDLEFFHDKGGLTHYEDNMRSLRNNFAKPTVVRRQLVDGSLEVYPIQSVGAVEIGVHRFYSKDPGGEERLTATARFIHLWRKDKGHWRVARVISYDHR